MEDDLYAFLDADNDSNHNEDIHGQFSKYRAVELPPSENLFQFAPQPSQKHAEFDATPFFLSTKKDLLISTSNRASPHHISASKCPEKPTRVCNANSFYTKESDFESIKSLVEKALANAESDYDTSYFPADCMWKCKYFQGSNIREFYVSCYWDSFCEDHLIEVKRVKGDGFLSGNCSKGTPADLFALVQATVMGSGESVKETKKGGRLRGPLPLPVLSSSKGSPNMSKEQFLKGLEPMLKMATSCNLETRLEAAKMLCDLADTSDKALLLLPECQDIIFQTLEFLLVTFSNCLEEEYEHTGENEFDDVKQFAIMAFGMFCEFEAYQECFLHLKNFNQIIQLINPNCSYSCLQMKRQASKGLSLLVKKSLDIKDNKTSKLFLMKQLQSHGFMTEDNWNCHCEQLADKRMKNSALEIGKCFQ